MKKSIVCFGDSNTWGYDAETDRRFKDDIRWTGILHTELGDAYRMIEEGLPGRTSVSEDPLFEGLSGISYIYPCLMSHSPLDLVVIMLGTNDTKERFGLTSYNIAQGIVRLALKAKDSGAGPEGKAPEVLVIAPLRLEQSIFIPLLANQWVADVVRSLWSSLSILQLY